MAKHVRINPFSRINNDTGFGNNANNYGGRFINRDGSFNVRKEGYPVWERFSIYHSMLNLPRWKFIAVILVFYLVINFIYTILYLLIGADQLQGLISKTPVNVFKEVFFFSTETFTTVGYGRVNPVGDGANILAAIESMSGFLSFALATGLIYGRFSKPKSYLLFSKDALISPYKDITALMFRFAPFKDNHTLTDVEIRINLGFQVIENDVPVYKFYILDLERSRVDSLPLNWTVVHPIDEKSPLFGFTSEDLKSSDLELYVLIKGFDDVYSNYVLQRTSYTYDEIHFNRKFKPMYRESEDGRTTILELNRINEHVEVPT
jgi:inward rectifier potassium channel